LLRLRHSRIGAAAVSQLSDATSIETLYRITAFLPMIWLLAYFLPKHVK